MEIFSLFSLALWSTLFLQILREPWLSLARVKIEECYVVL